MVHPVQTLAGLQAKVDAFVAQRLADLAAASARVGASTRMTGAQKASATTRIQAKVAALTALRAQVDSETTTKAVLADLRAAGELWDWDRHDGRHRHGKDLRSRAHGQVVVTGRGHAVGPAGQHGFGHHGGAHHR